jgi:GNAT superfamily N-acetyltransferase
VREIRSIGGVKLTIRPIRPTDVERLERMSRRLSPETIYLRFFSPMPRVPSAHLRREADVDHDRREALVAADGDEIVAVASYDAGSTTAPADACEAEIAVTVEDAWQHRGLGLLLARRLAVLARGRGCDAFVATVLPGNRAALDLVRRLGPRTTIRFADGSYVARVPLTRRGATVERDPAARD